MISVFGHINPDSDSICSAIVTADWLSFQGKDAIAYRLGEVNPETQFLLNEAQIDTPPLLEGSVKGKDVWMVDFSDLEQGPEGLVQSHVLGLIDHHRLGNLTTAEPLDVWIKYVGCCATIVFDLAFHQSGYQLSASHATLLLGAILSDTVGFQSPTTTEKDKDAAQHLALIAGVDLAEFTIKLLRAKTDISGLSPARLLVKDEKKFVIADQHIGLSQIELANFADITSLLPDLLTEMEARVKQESLDFYVLMTTSLSTSQSQLYFSANNPISTDPILMDNVISRKKQVLPWLIGAVENKKTY